MIYLAEFLGSFFLVATVVGSGIMGERLSPDNTAVALLGNTIPTGAILFVLIKMFGPVSGAHFNPAVSTVFLLRKEIDIQKFSKYIFYQFAGGLLAIIVIHFIFNNQLHLSFKLVMHQHHILVNIAQRCLQQSDVNHIIVKFSFQCLFNAFLLPMLKISHKFFFLLYYWRILPSDISIDAFTTHTAVETGERIPFNAVSSCWTTFF